MAIHFTEKEYEAFIGGKSERPRNKYRNKKVVYDDIEFDSTKERDRYIELKLMERAGEISDLKMQPEFELAPSIRENGKVVQRAIKYRADFSYIENGEIVIEDCKGYKTKVYEIKKKMMRLQGLEIKET